MRVGNRVGVRRATPRVGRYGVPMTHDTLTDRRWVRRTAGAALAGLALAGAACGSSSSSTSTTSTPKNAVVATGLLGKRYCEVLLVRPTAAGLVATVYNTYPLNACPADQWAAMDATAIASANGVPYAVLNGPRYWLMNSIAKVRTGAEIVKSFGGMAMIEEATVVLGTSVAAASVPFTPHTVSRQAAFTFAAGRQVCELVDPTGTTWVMQTYSQIKDPTLTQADLPGLASQLTLPTGWTYRVRTLRSPLVVATANQPAQVLQDNLENSYSKETSG